MALRTSTQRTGGSDFSPGWKLLTVQKASGGVWNNETPFRDVWFEGYPDNMNLRIFSKTNKDGEEFVLANFYKHANAGIVEVLESASGAAIVSFDDEAENLVGAQMWVYFYKEPSDSDPDKEYTRMLDRIAPVETEASDNVVPYTAKDVEYFKGRAETFFEEYRNPYKDRPGTPEVFSVETPVIETPTAEVIETVKAADDYM